MDDNEVEEFCEEELVLIDVNETFVLTELVLSEAVLFIWACAVDPPVSDTSRTKMATVITTQVPIRFLKPHISVSG
ncbi:MAG TPA: hypothetical protein VLV18_05260 [Terriglobales bacterium]|nr:hypothetical protein [Terriglobales bacterium]